MVPHFVMAESMSSWVDSIDLQAKEKVKTRDIDISKALREHISFDSTETGFYYLMIKTAVKECFGISEINSYLKRDIENLVKDRITALTKRMNEQQKTAVLETIQEKLNKMKILQKDKETAEALKKEIIGKITEILGIAEE